MYSYHLELIQLLLALNVKISKLSPGCMLATPLKTRLQLSAGTSFPLDGAISPAVPTVLYSLDVGCSHYFFLIVPIMILKSSFSPPTVSQSF